MRLGRWRVSGTVVAESAAELRLDLRLRGPFAFVGAWFARRMLRSRLPDSIGRVAVGLDELRKDIDEAGGADVLLHRQIWEPPPAEQNHPDPGVEA